MIELKINGKIISINCYKDFCGNCSYIQEPLCALFKVTIDRITSGNPDNSGLKRCSECINAEEKN